MKTTIKTFTALLLAMLCSSIFVSCNDDDDAALNVNEGVIFQLSRKIVYTTGVNEIGSVKITLKDAQGDKKVLPSLLLTGDEDLIQSAPCALAAGDYRIVAYTAYSTRHEFLFDAELDSLNEFKVLPNELTTFRMPIKTREILNFNFLKNAMEGICREVFGDDESLWPWDPQKYPYPDWEGLEFELDDYGSPMFLSGLTFQGLKDGKETPWAKMTRLPEGTLSNIAELATIVITDIPAFKELPSDLDRLPNLQYISCVNTGIEKLPDNFSALSTLSGLTLVNCQLKDFNYDLSKLKELHTLTLSNNQLETFDVALGGLSKLVSVDLSGNPLKSLGEQCFSSASKLTELRLQHTSLSSLPASLGTVQHLRSLDLSGAKFTEVPAVLNEISGLKTLILANNPLGRVTAADFAKMASLENLSLAGVQMTDCPEFTNPDISWLDLSGCGLTSAPSLNKYSHLCVLYLGNNEFTTLPSNYFSANKEMSILNLSNSPKLETLPELSLSPLYGSEEGLRLVEVENCPNLHWTAPASWNCYEFNFKNDWIFGEQEGDIVIPSDDTDAYFGRVGIRRNGSPYVQFGK